MFLIPNIFHHAAKCTIQPFCRTRKIVKNLWCEFWVNCIFSYMKNFIQSCITRYISHDWWKRIICNFIFRIIPNNTGMNYLWNTCYNWKPNKNVWWMGDNAAFSTTQIKFSKQTLYAQHIMLKIISKWFYSWTLLSFSLIMTTDLVADVLFWWAWSSLPKPMESQEWKHKHLQSL